MPICGVVAVLTAQADAAFGNPEYLEIWEKLEADPETFEVLRNLPLRYPLLWLGRSYELPITEVAEPDVKESL